MNKEIPFQINEDTLPLIRQMTEQMPGGFFIYKAEGNEEFILVNSALIKIAGCSDEQDFISYTKNSFKNFILPEFLENVEKSIREQVDKNADHQDYVEYPIRRKDGEIRWLRDFGRVSHSDCYGDIFYVFVDDWTERRKAIFQEEKYRILKKTDSILRAVTGDYICLIDVDLKTEKENRFQLNPSELPVWSDSDDYENAIRDFAEKYVCEQDRKRFLESTKLDVLLEYLTENPEYIIEYDADIKNGKRHFQGKFLLNDKDTDEPHLFVAIRDITDSEAIRFKEQTELKKAKQLAENANKVKTTFLFNMSHDIRTPMNAIVGFAKLLGTNLDNKELCKNYIRKIQNASDLLLELINNVLEMARIENGKVSLEETKYHTEAFNDTLFSVFEVQMNEKHIKFTRNINVQHNYVWCDAIKLKKIFLNILGNAYKYTPDGGSVTMNLTEITSDIPGYAIFKTEISDTGIGMSKDFIPHIFDSFSRERNTTECRIEGTGLGMSIVQEYVKLMNGSIDVESEPRKGSKFTVILPHRIVTEEEKDESFVATTELNYSFEGRRVLLAEDNDLNAEISTAILEEFGIEVQRAADGLQCVEMISEVAPDYYDVILMDIQMPKLNGFEATSVIKAMEDRKKAEIPIIAMTANAFEEDKQKAFAAGMEGHISKPINVNDLVQTLSEIIGKR